MTAFSLEALGCALGPTSARRRDEFDAMDWAQLAPGASAKQLSAAREVWTRSAFSEYASGAAFAAIASALLEAKAPIDLVAAAGEFVADEMVHAELASRVAMALGGAVLLDVDFSRLVRPPQARSPLMRAAELVVRTCCVGEALTVPVLGQSHRLAGSAIIEEVIARLLRDEVRHAALGWWFLDWAPLSEDERGILGKVAGGALRGFEALLAPGCSSPVGLGALNCATLDPVFVSAVTQRVLRPLAERGIEVPAEDVTWLTVRAAG